MVTHLRKLYRYRELLWIWTQREIKIRYKQSFLGAFWAVLQPLAMMLVFTTVFSVLTRIPTDPNIPYPVFSYSALLPWTFFAASISFGSNSLVTNLNLVTKTYFPREILPLGAIGASFFDFLVASTIFLVMLLAYQVRLTWALLWLPVLLVVQMLLSAGISLAAAALTVFYRDFRFIVPLGIQIWLFLSPVIYPASLVPERFRGLYMLNPMAGVLDSYRRVALYGQAPSLEGLGLAALVAVVISFAGYRLFKRLERSFPDLI